MLICAENDGVSQKEIREDLLTTLNEVSKHKKVLVGS